MNTVTLLIIIVIVLLIIFVLGNLRRIVIFEHQKGLLYRYGKFQKLLSPGQHWYFRAVHTIQRVDTRSHLVSIPGQEVLSADNVSIKVSLVANFKIGDPYRAISEVVDYFQAIYLELQVNLRDIVGEIPIDEFLSARQNVGEQLLERSKDSVLDFGIILESVSIKDIMFPGELKKIFAQVVNAQKEGLAALERARGESAALRNLANTAKLLEKNPGLLQLRILQAIDNNPGNTIILGDVSDITPKIKLLEGDKTDD